MYRRYQEESVKEGGGKERRIGEEEDGIERGREEEDVTYLSTRDTRNELHTKCGSLSLGEEVNGVFVLTGIEETNQSSSFSKQLYINIYRYRLYNNRIQNIDCG